MDTGPSDQILPLVYDELRRLAAARLAREKPGHTLQATALVHEAYLRIAGSSDQWHGRGHFFAAAAEAMRRILVDQARAKKSLKGGGQLRKVELTVNHPETEDGVLDLLALDEALAALQRERPRHFALTNDDVRGFDRVTVPSVAMTCLDVLGHRGEAETIARGCLDDEVADDIPVAHLTIHRLACQIILGSGDRHQAEIQAAIDNKVAQPAWRGFLLYLAGQAGLEVEIDKGDAVELWEAWLLNVDGSSCFRHAIGAFIAERQ